MTTVREAVTITEQVFGPTYPEEPPPVEHLEALAEDVLDRLRRRDGSGC